MANPKDTLMVEGFTIIKDQMRSVINNLAAQKQDVPKQLDTNYRKLCKLIDDVQQYLDDETGEACLPPLNTMARPKLRDLLSELEPGQLHNVVEDLNVDDENLAFYADQSDLGIIARMVIEALQPLDEETRFQILTNGGTRP